jgi:hypothetical protein
LEVTSADPACPQIVPRKADAAGAACPADHFDPDLSGSFRHLSDDKLLDLVLIVR